jgi:hypothetical protein
LETKKEAAKLAKTLFLLAPAVGMRLKIKHNKNSIIY